MSIKRAAMRGAIWSIAERCAIQAIAFVVTIAMARRLTPADYGQVGVLLILMELGRTAIDGGLGQCLIRNHGGTPRERHTVFLFNLLLSLLLYLLLWFCAPLIARLYGNQGLIPLCRWLGAILPLYALSMVQRAVLTARMEFRAQTIAGISAGLSAGIIGVIMAYSGLGIASLVAYQLIHALVTAIMLRLRSAPDTRPSAAAILHPRRHLSLQALRDMWKFGGGVVTASLIDGIYNNFIYGIITSRIGAAALGGYTRARQIASLPANNLSDIIQKVSYPSLCQVRTEPTTLQRHFLKYITLSAWASIPILTLIALFSRPIVMLLLGEQWGIAATILPWICLSLMILPMQTLNLNLLLVAGETRRYLHLEIVKKIVGSLIMILGISYGLPGLCAAFPAISVISLIINSSRAHHIAGAGLLRQLLAIADIRTLRTTILSLCRTLRSQQ